MSMLKLRNPNSKAPARCWSWLAGAGLFHVWISLSYGRTPVIIATSTLLHYTGHREHVFLSLNMKGWKCMFGAVLWWSWCRVTGVGSVSIAMVKVSALMEPSAGGAAHCAPSRAPPGKTRPGTAAKTQHLMSLLNFSQCDHPIHQILWF